MPEQILLFATTVLLFSLPTTQGYSNGDVRLIGGTFTHQGRVEIWYNSQWNTVCDDSWSLNDATVVCQQLGYRGAVTAHRRAYFGQGSGNILLDDLLCTGREASLLECRHSGINVHNCGHNEDASVTCTSTRFSSGSLRLVNGYASSVGRVEIWYSNQWNTVCDDYWGISDANVVCRQLGYGGAALAHQSAYFGQGSGQILLDNLRCSGTETSLFSCPHRGIYSHNCGHSEDASATCQSSGNIRLVGGSNRYEGRVEVWYDSRWNTVCDDNWDLNEAKVVCQQLGYRTAITAHREAHFGQGSGQILLDNLHCTGTESSLLSCPRNTLYSHNCGHHEDAGVTCGCSDPGTSYRISRTLNGTAVGDTVTYTCPTGYILSGSSSRTCLTGVYWSGTLPSCNIVTCSILTAPSNGGRTYSGRNYNDRVTFSCSTGYRLRGSSSRTCQANGQWSGTQPTCVRFCGDPGIPVNGVRSITGYTQGHTVTYTCNTGYRLMGNPIITCQTNGVWSGSLPTCLIVTCSLPLTPSNGQCTYRGRNYNDRVTFSCNTGYRLTGSWSRTCQASGQWSGTQPTCNIVTCNSPAPPVNGSVTFDIVEYGSAINYTCDTGFLLQGNSSRVCQANGRWSDRQPSCQVVHCPDLEELTNGRVAGNSTSYQSTALYECREGYMIIGSSLRTCGVTGQWSSSMPTCANSSAIIGGSLLVVILAIGTLVVILMIWYLCKGRAYCRRERKQEHFPSVVNAMAMSAMDRGGNDYCNRSISEDVDEPIFAKIELAIATSSDKTMAVLEEKGYAKATAGLPSDDSEPRYYESPCTAPSGSMYVASGGSPSDMYASLNEAGIQKEGEYCTIVRK